MAQTIVMVKNEVKKDQDGNWVLYLFGEKMENYNKLEFHLADIIELTGKAISEGWGNFTD